MTLTQRYEYEIGNQLQINSGFLVNLLTAQGPNLENINSQNLLEEPLYNKKTIHL